MKILLSIAFIALAALPAQASLKAQRVFDAAIIADQAAVDSTVKSLVRCDGVPRALGYAVSSAFANTSCVGSSDPEACCTGAGTGTCDAEAKIEYSACADLTTCEAVTIGADVVADTGAGTDPELWHIVEWPEAVTTPYIRVTVTGLANNPSDTIATVDVFCADPR